MHLLLIIWTMLALAATSPAPGAQGKQLPPYRIVVHPGNPATVLDRRFLEDAFLKKIKQWPHGDTIKPVDLEPNSEVRRRFTEQVLRRPLTAVRAYWQQRIFSGRELPPPELESDEEVISYVRKHAGAVGYVSGGASLDGLKAIAIQ
jgi:ABC-type phosphate transport system substrate-binding protein